MATFWTRFNTLLLLVTLLSVIGLFATRALGGPLDPPAAPTTGTDGVRGPGTPISSLPFTTTAGGHFYVTRNLSAGAGQSGITICCSNTTIDLGGFTLFGAGAGMNPQDGIYNAGARNVVIRNGAVRGWYNGINLGGTYSRVEGVYATANLATGIAVNPGSVVVDCNASLNGIYGVSVDGAVVRNCTMSENSSAALDIESYSLAEDNRINANPGGGVRIDGHYNTIRNNELSGNGIFGDIAVSNFTLGNVIMANAYCFIVNNGTSTVITGNVDRVDAC